MSDNGHAENAHAKKQPANPSYKIPLALPIIALLVIAGMWFYSDRYDPGNPKNVVTNLYKALNAKQYDRVADSFNVTFLAEFMPEYLDKKPSELQAGRAELVAKGSELFAKQQTEGTFMVTVLTANTKVGDFAAVVPYYLEMDGQKQLLAAILVKENGSFKILSISSFSEAIMQEFSDAKFQVLEENIKAEFAQAEKAQGAAH